MVPSPNEYHQPGKQEDFVTKAVFLDRDGIICKDRDDYVKSWDEFVWIPGARKALKRLSGNHRTVIVITNQSAVGRGLVSRLSVEDIHQRMMRGVHQAGGRIEKVYYCPHRPEDDCNCRKPKPGLLLKAARDFALDLKSSYLVGDSLSDVEAGRYVGCTTMMVRNDKKAGSVRSLLRDKTRPDYIVSDLSAAVDLILKLDSADR